MKDCALLRVYILIVCGIEPVLKSQCSKCIFYCIVNFFFFFLPCLSLKFVNVYTMTKLTRMIHRMFSLGVID